MAALLVGTVGVFTRVWPQEIPYDPVRESWIEGVFASRAVVASLRVVILYIAVFVAISIAMRIWNRQWLRKAGPFEVSEETLHNFKAEIEFWQDKAQDAEDQIEELHIRVNETEDVLGEALDLLAKSQKEVDKLRRQDRKDPS